LGDEKKTSEQMGVFTPDVVYKVCMNGPLVSTLSGIENMEREFSGHAARVKTYFTLNGQHTVKIDGNTAKDVLFSPNQNDKRI
jgi:hypothetical protein